LSDDLTYRYTTKA